MSGLGREWGRGGKSRCGRGLGGAWLRTWEPMSAGGQDVPTPRMRNAKGGSQRSRRVKLAVAAGVSDPHLRWSGQRLNWRNRSSAPRRCDGWGWPKGAKGLWLTLLSTTLAKLLCPLGAIQTVPPLRRPPRPPPLPCPLCDFRIFRRIFSNDIFAEHLLCLKYLLSTLPQ